MVALNCQIHQMMCSQVQLNSTNSEQSLILKVAKSSKLRRVFASILAFNNLGKTFIIETITEQKRNWHGCHSKKKQRKKQKTNQTKRRKEEIESETWETEKIKKTWGQRDIQKETPNEKMLK